MTDFKPGDLVSIDTEWGMSFEVYLVFAVSNKLELDLLCLDTLDTIIGARPAYCHLITSIFRPAFKDIYDQVCPR